MALLAVSRARRYAKRSCFVMMSSAFAVRERLLEESTVEPQPGEVSRLSLGLRPYWGVDGSGAITYAGRDVAEILPELLPQELSDSIPHLVTQIQSETPAAAVTLTVVIVEVAIRFPAPQDQTRCLQAAFKATDDWLQSKGLVSGSE